ncbi:MAG TPA: hypothetical protein VFS11_05815 [Gemmatimonadales bacterium]|nr:hypothetical protein [Gemmatimonadales bacterium]
MSERESEATPAEIAAVARQFSAMRAMIVACLAQLDAMAASLGVPMAVAGGVPGGAVNQTPAQSARRDPRERPAFNRTRLVEDAPASSASAPIAPAANLLELLDREVDPCPSAEPLASPGGAPTADRAMTPLDVEPATGTGAATGDAVMKPGAPCA